MKSARPPGFHSARQNKGHPRRQARRDRAAMRLEIARYSTTVSTDMPELDEFFKTIAGTA